EWVHVQLHQQKGMISLSPPTICNSAETTAVSGLFQKNIVIDDAAALQRTLFKLMERSLTAFAA
ncbi:hypothetical protein, partial [Escherichia coli]|uniref:hypothetical protein n=1 Tax=Escherichia coli TaxID=562 RepID=UPI001BC8A255